MVTHADWQSEEVAIALVRRTVFIEEQSVPEALEWEEIDPKCFWFVARPGTNAGAGGEEGKVIGIVRLTPDARIGRMAVCASWRGQGVGSALLASAMAEAHRQGYACVRLSAQTHAASFYVRHGFQAEGEIYLDAGIPHVAMTFKDTP